jgi:hypothetical protein
MFDAMGQRTYRVGAEPRRAKIAGNLMVACAIEARAEAAALLHKDTLARPPEQKWSGPTVWWRRNATRRAPSD